MKLAGNGRDASQAPRERRLFRRRKKRNEIFQMAVLEPKLAILDETDSGLDIDALKIVANGVNTLRSQDRAMVVITHYQRLLNYIVPDFVHVLANGRIVKSGGKDLALELEEKGYGWTEPETAGSRGNQGEMMSETITATQAPERYLELFGNQPTPDSRKATRSCGKRSSTPPTTTLHNDIICSTGWPTEWTLIKLLKRKAPTVSSMVA